MNSAIAVDRVVNELDHARLQKIGVKGMPSDLADLLENADLVAPRAISGDRVSMYSLVEVQDSRSASKQKLTLCYPEDAEPANGFISVLSPVGTSLLGLKVGSTATWRSPTGEKCQLKVLRILFQPEASGDYIT